MSPDVVSPQLAALAAAMGVATRYDDYLQRPVEVGAEAVRFALRAMGIPANDDAEIAAALAQARSDAAARVVPPALVVRPGETVALPSGAQAAITFEDGTQIEASAGALPDGLPLGYHRLDVATGGATTSAHLIVTPGVCPLPLTEPGYGWMAQLYAVRSATSWGIGDCRDLATLGAWGGEVGAAMVLVNPLHATAPVLPQEPSPYSPTSRRYRNPIYLAIEDIPEMSGLDDDQRRQVATLAEQARRAGGGERIDRDLVFAAKTAALELLHAAPRTPQREAAYRRWADGEGEGLARFATFCALAEQHGMPWQAWPASLQHPDHPDVLRARHDLADRVALHMWSQWLLDEQLRDAQSAATGAGMSIGVIHDLAVGVNPGGADAWALQDDLAIGARVGAPPDGFNQRGQDWGLPPLRPDRLAQTGYAPFADMLRSVLRHAGGIRIDHIMGLWRLWWVPEGRPASEGTYVSYPARDLLGVLALEAHRAGAMVVGEDLGTVAPGVRETMAEHRILSSKVLYFERVDDDPEQPRLPAAAYPEVALTSITTHDLPTPAGWWADEEIRTQTDLGLFGEQTTPAAQAQRKAGERADMLTLLRSEGLLGEDPTDEELVLAMHRFLARTPSLLVATGLGDALGDRRQPNMPGTVDEYPNWRLPVARWDDGSAIPVTLEQLMADPGVRSVASMLALRTS